MKTKEIIRLLKRDGWIEIRQRGSHKQYVHPYKKGRVTVAFHTRELPIRTAESILKQAGLK